MDTNTKVSPQPNMEFSVEMSESLHEKTSLLDVSASLKVSFLAGLVEVGGSAKYLNEKTSSTRQCSTTLKYSMTTEHKELNISNLTMIEPEVLNTTDATHVVVEVTYGADAIMEFQETASDDSKKQEIQTNLYAMVKLIPSIVTVDVSVGVNMSNQDKEKVKNFNCMFFGDIHISEIPSTYEEAVKVCKELPKLLGEKFVPVKVWLYPLSKLTNTQSKLKRMISELLVHQLMKAMEELYLAQAKTNDLLESSSAIKAEDITKKLSQFHDSLELCIKGFRQKMAGLISAIREGTTEETALTDLLKSLDASGFSGREMNQWLERKRTEINVITMHIKAIDQYQIKSEGSELFSFLLNPNVSDAFVFSFTSLKYHEPYLKKISQHSAQEASKEEEAPWFLKDDALKSLRTAIDVFNSAILQERIVSFISDPRCPGAALQFYCKTNLKNPHVTCIPKQFACELTLDENTAHMNLALSEGRRKASHVRKRQSYDNSPLRFGQAKQVLSAQPLPAGRSYFECEWEGDHIRVGVAYDTIPRKGDKAWIGGNKKSWSIRFFKNNCHVCINEKFIRLAPPPPGTKRVGVYVDRAACILAFYIVNASTHKLWHKIEIPKNNDALYAGFWMTLGCSLSFC